MTVVNKEYLACLKLNKSGEEYTKGIVEYAIKIIKERIKEYVDDVNVLNLINERINNLSYEFLSSQDFANKYSGKNSELASGFYYQGIIYLKKDFDEIIPKEFHTLVHEILHAISDSSNGKLGLLERTQDGSWLGFSMNEAATEYLTALILEESFNGYVKDIKNTLLLVMQIMNMDNAGLISTYLNSDSWLAKSEKYNSEDLEALIKFNKLFDQRTIFYQNQEFDPNLIMSNLLEALNLKIKKGESFDYSIVRDLLNELQVDYSYIYGLEDGTIKDLENYESLMKL